MLLTLRCNLAGVMLQLMALGIPDVTNFDFMSKPSPGKMLSVRNPLRSSGKRCRVSCSSALCFTPEAIRSAVDHLELLGAVEKKDGQVFLTTLGKKMASFPLEPRYAKVNPAGIPCTFSQRQSVSSQADNPSVCSTPQTILLSPDYSCSEEILSIVSLLSVDTVLYNPPARRDEVLAVRKKFMSSEGDHMTLLNIYRAFKKVSGNKVGAMNTTNENTSMKSCC